MFAFYPPHSQKYSTSIAVEKLFTAEECSTILEISKAYDEAIPQVTTEDGEEIENNNYINSTIRSIPWNDDTDWLYQRLYNTIIDANNECFHFDLSGIYEGLDIIQYNTHGSMGWHADGLTAGQASTRKISMSVQLVDPEEYEGGDLEFFAGEIEKSRKGLGTIILFPSYMYHQVSTVTAGTRITLIAHAHGHPYR